MSEAIPNEPLGVVFHYVYVSKDEDGYWFALRGAGSAVDLERHGPFSQKGACLEFAELAFPTLGVEDAA